MTATSVWANEEQGIDEVKYHDAYLVVLCRVIGMEASWWLLRQEERVLPSRKLKANLWVVEGGVCGEEEKGGDGSGAGRSEYKGIGDPGAGRGPSSS